MNENKSASAGGVGFVGLLQVAFIVLKLCGIIKWSWFWVVAPTWIAVGIFVLMLSIALILTNLGE